MHRSPVSDPWRCEGEKMAVMLKPAPALALRPIRTHLPRSFFDPVRRATVHFLTRLLARPVHFLTRYGSIFDPGFLFSAPPPQPSFRSS